MKPKLQPHKMGCEGKEDKRYCDCGAVLLNNQLEEYDQWIVEWLEDVLSILRTESRSLLTVQMTEVKWLQSKRNAASRKLDTLIQKIKES